MLLKKHRMVCGKASGVIIALMRFGGCSRRHRSDSGLTSFRRLGKPTTARRALPFRVSGGSSYTCRTRHPPGILLAVRMLVSRAGATQGPISPTYQHAGANQMKRENNRSFLLLLFLTTTAALEFRHGAVVAFQFADVSVRFRLGDKPISGDSERPRQLRERDHYGLICSLLRFNRSCGRAIMFSQVWSAFDI